MTAPRQRLSSGIVAAVVGALVGAALWALLVTVTDYKIGYAAIGVGALAGFLAGRFGGADPKLPFIAAGVGLVGCLLGDLLANAHAVSITLAEEGISASMFTVLRKMAEHPDFGWEVYQAGFKGMDVLFYGFAGYAALRLAAQHGAPQAAPAVPPPSEPTTPAATSAEPDAAS